MCRRVGSTAHLRVMAAIEQCRTAALGGHVEAVRPLRTQASLVQTVAATDIARHARRELDRLVHRLAEAAPADDPNASAEDDPSSKELPDAAILRSLPGIGTKVLATLVAEGSDAVGRRDYNALRCL